MKLLLDTHTFLWAISTPERIPQNQLDEMLSFANSVYVSSVSVAEIMIKASIGKLQIDFDPNQQIRDSGFLPLNFSGSDAIRLGELPFHHRDPFDRMLISQAIERGLTVVTQDQAFGQYHCRLL